MSIEDPVTQLLKEGQEKMGTAVQNTLLTQISCKSTNNVLENFLNLYI